MDVKIDVVVDKKELLRMLRALPETEIVRILHDGTDYGVHVHEGYVHWKSGQHIGGRPFLGQAVERVRPTLKKAVGDAIEKGLDVEAVIDKVAMNALDYAKASCPWDTGNLRGSLDVSDKDAVMRLLS